MTGRAFLFLPALLAWAAPAAAADAPALLPRPAHIAVQAGRFDLTAATPLVAAADDGGARNAALRLAEWMAAAGRPLQAPVPRADGPAIRFARTPGLAAEGYRLRIDADGATVSASDDSGLLYGAVTLWQLAGTPGPLPYLTIDDAPRFGWRGVMLDSARHFQSPAFVKQLIDWMSANKLNRLHWHLVDDQGWRIEIRKYPKLTGISAWRSPAVAPGAPPLPPTGGFYSQSEIHDIVAYAGARGIVIIPEIEMPGHATAAIRAYPALGMGVPLPDGVWSDWGVFPWLYNSDDATFTFLQDVLDEVMALFPSPWIHLGGDEATKEQWKADPATQARIRALGLADENALQGWFMARIGNYLAGHGRRMIGWDEILEGGVPADAVVMSWRGVDGAVTAARAGHDAILSAAPTLYFDHRQGTGPDEPPGRGAPVTLADVYAFDPAPAALTPDQHRHIMGVQGNLWTEHVRTEARAAWMLFPRAAAVAEIGWSPAGGKDYADFLSRLKPQLARMAPLGLKAADSAFADAPPPAPLARTSRQLESCTGGILLDLEDDYPAQGPRAHFLTDILNPCWIWRGAPLAGAGRISLSVGQIPFNFEIGADLDKIRFRPPATPDGEFEVRAGGCKGRRIAVLPLAPARDNPGLTRVEAAVAPTRARRTDLCITYTARGVSPMWALDAVALEPR